MNHFDRKKGSIDHGIVQWRADQRCDFVVDVSHWQIYCNNAISCYPIDARRKLQVHRQVSFSSFGFCGDAWSALLGCIGRGGVNFESCRSACDHDEQQETQADLHWTSHEGHGLGRPAVLFFINQSWFSHLMKDCLFKEFENIIDTNLTKQF